MLKKSVIKMRFINRNNDRYTYICVRFSSIAKISDIRHFSLPYYSFYLPILRIIAMQPIGYNQLILAFIASTMAGASSHPSMYFLPFLRVTRKQSEDLP